jgi:glycosyltransferase involved in cell wall biosynthesis
MKIGIFTTFYNLDTAYSLVTVVKQQLKMLVKHGYTPVLFVLENFNDDTVLEGVEVRKTIPQLILEPYGHGDLSNLDKDVEKAKKALEETMVDIDVCLTHDIIFINSYLPYNIAMRKAIDGKLNKVKWLHWMHSGPSIRPQLDDSPWDNLYTLPANSRLIYMNYTDSIRAAEMYGVWPKDVKTIFNPMDIREFFDVDPFVWDLTDSYDILNAEFICVYPLSTTRMGPEGKQVAKVIEIMADLKQLGRKVKLIIPNAHANGKREKEAIEEQLQIAGSLGLDRSEVIFTSLFNAPKYEHGLPHHIVKDLFLIGNLFIFPSVSENCPLIQLEAMAAKSILVLNKNFPAMKDFTLENAMYFNFGSLVETPNFPLGEDRYLMDVAKLINSEYENNKAVKAHTLLRQRFNVDKIFKQQLEPAIYDVLNN